MHGANMKECPLDKRLSSVKTSSKAEETIA